MPTPDTSGVPPWADFEDLKNKMNELVAKYNNLLVNLDSLNVVSLTADHIDAGTIDANKVKIRSDLTAGAYVQIDGNGMIINNGSVDTFKADIDGNVTMTSATIQSASGYPKVELDPSGNLLGAYADANNSVQVSPAFGGGAPAIAGTVNGNPAYLLTGNTSGVVLSTTNLPLTLSTDIQGDIFIKPQVGYSIKVRGWDGIFADGAAPEFLSDALAAKADGSGISGTVYVATTSGGAATTAITFSNGVRTS